MYIKNISLKNFRNYDESYIEFDKNMNLIVGENAQGKTNLIEAIYMMSMGKSFRTSRDMEMVNFDSDFFRIKLEAENKEEEMKLEMIVSHQSKAVKINGINIKKASELLQYIYVVAFTPEDLKIVKEDPEKRRRFIDVEMCKIKPVYFTNISKYKKIMMQRNAMLKEGNIDIEMLKVWDYELVKYGCGIMKERDIFINKLKKISKKIHNNISNGKENIEIIYEPNVKLASEGESQKELFLEKINRNRNGDIQKKTTSVGPHRDDLKIVVNGIDIRKYGSQGQQRTAALSLKLAEIEIMSDEIGEECILILDDVLSELDEERQRFLINSLSGVQKFVTAAEISEKVEKSLPEGLKIYVKNGNLEVK